MTHHEGDLVAALVRMTSLLVSDFDPEVLGGTLVDECVRVLDITDAAVLLADRAGSLTVVAATSGSCRAVVEEEVAAGEGPSIDAFISGETVLVASPAALFATWTRLASRLETSAYTKWIGLPLRAESMTVGALTLHLDSGCDLTTADLEAAQALADVATIGIIQGRLKRDGATTLAQLQVALDSRVVIEQAKGMLSQMLGVGPSAAFVELRRRARNSGRRLTDVATEIVNLADDGSGEQGSVDEGLGDSSS